jgi:Signal transduction histidine kinase
MGLRKIRVETVIGVLLFLFITNLSGQYQNIMFDHYTPNHGLSNGNVTSIIQDDRGFLWIGTEYGLNRFDGVSFKKYFFNSNDSASVPNNLIDAFVKDTLGNLWILTNRGLCIYNQKKDNFTRKFLHVNQKVYKDLVFISGCIDKDGYLWLGSWGEIYRIKLYNNHRISDKTIEAEKFMLPEKDTDGAFRTLVYSIIQDNSGKIWVSSYSNKLYYFDKRQHSFVGVKIDLPEAGKFSNKNKYLLKCSDDNFVISIEQSGLVVWDRKYNQFRLFKPDGTDNGPNDNVLYASWEDSSGNIWIGSRSAGGINIFNPATSKFSYLIHNPLNSSSISANSLNCIYGDRFGNVWIGTGMGIGVDRYSPGRQKFNQYSTASGSVQGLNNDNILCFTESKSGLIYIGTDGGGLNVLDRTTRQFTHYTHKPSDPKSLSSNAIVSICEDHEGTLWMGTYNGGLAYFKNGCFDAFLPRASDPYSLSYLHVWFVKEDSKNNLWAGTLNHGLDLFDRRTQRFYHYTTNNSDSTSLSNNGIRFIFEDTRQNLYIGTNEGINVINLNQYDFTRMPPKLKFKRYVHRENENSLSSNSISCIAEDKAGNIWIGTFATGLDMLDVKTGKFTNYNTNDGLPGNVVSSVLQDDKGNLWLATDRGLAQFNLETKNIKVFDKTDGLANTNLRGHALKTKDGEMYFGGTEGFNSFHPDRIQFNQNKPVVVLTGLKIYNKPIGIGDTINGRVILENDISVCKKIVLSYKDNFFTISFVALDYAMPEKNQFNYKMQGFDKDWIQCGNKREASYMNLDPGKYYFRVKACNNDDVWNEKETILEIVVLPPWWRTLWFRLSLIGSLLLLAISAFYGKIYSYKNRQKELTYLVRVRTEELQQKNQQLQREQARIVEQKEQLEIYAEKVHSHNEELKTANEKLLENQVKIEEQAEDLRSHSQNLREANTLLMERQKLIEAQSVKLEETNHQLSVLNSTKDRFFSIIAHDLRNPFHTVAGFSEILLRDYAKLSPEKTERYLKLINQSATNGNALLENLLQWSRAQTGRISFDPVNLSLYEVVNVVFILLETEAERKHISLKQDISSSVTVVADENMLMTILRNLISNAIKFTPENGSITISFKNHNKMVEVSVTDTGVGIATENIKYLFDVEKNFSTRGTASETGTGLGLILCKEFVERNGGKIWVVSEPDKGSTFTFTLHAK